MSVNTSTIVIGGAAVVAVATAVYAVSQVYAANKKISSIAEKLNATLDEVTDSIEFDAKDISDAIIEEAVEKAVDKAAKKAADDALSKVAHTFDDDIRRSVKDAVEAEKSNMKGKIKEQIEKQIGYIDINDVKREVVEAAKIKAAEKFQEDLDAVVTKHNDELKNIQTIYSSIADSMRGGK